MSVLSLWFTLLWANFLGPGHEGNMNSLSLSKKKTKKKKKNLSCFILPFTGLNNQNFAML